jgi:hypothetical protein
MNKTAKSIIAGAAALSLFLFTDLPSAQGDTVLEPTPMQQIAHGLNPANWRMPQWKMPDFRSWLPGNDEKARIKKKKDGLVDEVSATASNSWNKTKRALNPQKLNPVNFFPASSRTPSARKVEESKPGFFRSLLAPQPPPPTKSPTVTDFLRQPRVGE